LDEKLAYYGNRPLDPKLAARYWRHLAATAGARVLDVGCGAGAFGQFAPPGVEVFGVDHDPGAVRRASSTMQAAVVDLEEGTLPFPDGHFAGVLAKDILEHVARPTRLLAEIRRVLSPGGRLVVSVPMEYPWVVWADYTHHRGFTRQAVTLMLADSDFADIVVSPIGAVPGAGRLGLANFTPKLLALPLMRPLFGRSWEAVAKRR
jgi:SAM-dependent methyltransferase